MEASIVVGFLFENIVIIPLRTAGIVRLTVKTVCVLNTWITGGGKASIQYFNCVSRLIFLKQFLKIVFGFFFSMSPSDISWKEEKQLSYSY